MKLCVSGPPGPAGDTVRTLLRFARSFEVPNCCIILGTTGMVTIMSLAAQSLYLWHFHRVNRALLVNQETMERWVHLVRLYLTRLSDV